MQFLEPIKSMGTGRGILTIKVQEKDLLNYGSPYLDIFTLGGGPFKPYSISTQVRGNYGKIVISIGSTRQNPMISAIGIQKIGRSSARVDYIRDRSIFEHKCDYFITKIVSERLKDKKEKIQYVYINIRCGAIDINTRGLPYSLISVNGSKLNVTKVTKSKAGNINIVLGLKRGNPMISGYRS